MASLGQNRGGKTIYHSNRPQCMDATFLKFIYIIGFKHGYIVQKENQS